MNSSCQKKHNATNEERIAIVTFLSERHKNGRLNKGAIDVAMEYFPFKRSQIKVIWRLARDADVDPNARVEFTTKKKGNSGWKPKYSQESLITAIQSTPLSQRSTLRSLSKATLIPVSTLGKMRKKGWLVAITEGAFVWQSLKEHSPTEGVNGPPVYDWRGCHICSCEWTRAIATHWII